MSDPFLGFEVVGSDGEGRVDGHDDDKDEDDDHQGRQDHDGLRVTRSTHGNRPFCGGCESLLVYTWRHRRCQFMISLVNDV